MTVKANPRGARFSFRTIALVIGALACLAYLLVQALDRRRATESLDSAAGHVLNAVLAGDGGTLFQYMPDDEKKPLDIDRGDISRMANWAHHRLEGYVPKGAPVKEGGEMALALTQELQDGSGNVAFVRIHIRTGPRGPVAPLVPHTLAMSAMSATVPMTVNRDSALVRAEKLHDAFKRDLPTLNSFCSKIRTATLRGPIVTWEEYVDGRARSIQMLTDRLRT